MRSFVTRSSLRSIGWVLALAAAACGGDDSATHDDPGGNDDRYDNVVSSTVAVTLRNLSSRTYVSLYISTSDSNSWGADLLPGVLPPGANFTLQIPCGEYYDVRAVDAQQDSSELYEEFYACGYAHTVTLRD